MSWRLSWPICKRLKWMINRSHDVSRLVMSLVVAVMMLTPTIQAHVFFMDYLKLRRTHMERHTYWPERSGNGYWGVVYQP